MIKRYSKHKIFDKFDCPFSEKEYSLFKFGDTSFAEKFAKELFQGFISEHKDWILSNDEIIIIASPHYSIPTASNFLCHYFKKELNYFLYENDKKSCIESKIYRTQTYTQDYGEMNFEQRIKLISNDTYYIDQSFINEKCCIFLDDIKITGSHEYIVNKILAENQIKGNFIFLYYAELMNMEIEPNIENYYNYYALKDYKGLIGLLTTANFKFNTRVVKYILKLEQSNFTELMEHLPDHQKKELFELAISNNYHHISEYQQNLNFLNTK